MELLNVAAQHLANGQLKEAESLCLLIVQTTPQVTGVYYLLALIANKKGDFRSAVAYCDRAIEMKAGVAEVFLEKARAMLGLGDREGAIAALTQAAGRAPDLPGVRELAAQLVPPPAQP